MDREMALNSLDVDMDYQPVHCYLFAAMHKDHFNLNVAHKITWTRGN